LNCEKSKFIRLNIFSISLEERTEDLGRDQRTTASRATDGPLCCSDKPD